MLNILKDFSGILAYRTEEDTSGHYRANFLKQDSNQEGTKLFKQKLEYLSTTEAVLPRILKSEHHLSLDPAGKPVAATGKEITHISQGQSSSLSTTSSYRLSLKGSSIRPIAVRDREGFRETTLALNPQRGNAPRVQAWSELLGALDSICSIASQQRLKLFHELVKSLKFDASNFKNFMAWLSDHGAEAGIRTFAIGVLASAGTPEAQSALVKWFHEFPESRTVILNAFTTSHAGFTSETLGFLDSLVEDRSGDSDSAWGAAFALGAGLRNDTVPDGGEVNRLEGLLNSASSAEEKVAALGAIGNSGNQAFLPVIERNLGSSDENIRETAVLALRFMPGNDTQEWVNQAWSDASIKVRAAAIQVIEFQGTPGLHQDVLQDCVESSPDLRSSCQRALDSIGSGA